MMMHLLAQAPLLVLPEPWNWIGLAVATLVALMVLAIVLVVVLKLARRGEHKPPAIARAASPKALPPPATREQLKSQTSPR